MKLSKRAVLLAALVLRAARKVVLCILIIRFTYRIMKTVGLIALALLIIGGLNWGLVGLFNIDLVALLFGPMTGLSRTIYVLIGASAVVAAFTMLPLRATR